jgi:hypothetical protein
MRANRDGGTRGTRRGRGPLVAATRRVSCVLTPAAAAVAVITY